jgi:hypothetical protein
LSDDFDWNPLGEAWWRDTARQLGASDKQTKFAAAKHRGCSNTEAARQAGYEASTESGLRTTGYRLARANIIEKLLAFAAGEGVGSEGNVDRQEARRILSSLARGSDPSVRIRAVEQLARFDEADRQQRLAQQEPEPKEVAANILRACPYMGPGIIADCYLAEAGTPWGIPYLKELAPILARDFSKLWLHLRECIKEPTHIADFDALASAPVLTVDQIIGPDKPVEKKEDAAQ